MRMSKKLIETCCRNFNFKLINRNYSMKAQSVWEPTIGLEIHAQIATKSKLFSSSPTDFAKPVNTCVSLFDCATPGTLPVLNRKCVEAGVLTALALSCDVNEVSMFERKHYFYADLPAGFQITQHRYPLASNGEIKFPVFKPGPPRVDYTKSCRIKQIQLEQDSGRSLHIEQNKKSLIDLNRAGIPLMELVFDPELHSADEAYALVKELLYILELLGTCSCKMEEGALRVDVNVSVSRKGEPLGVRTEIKNIGSIHGVSNAIKYEIRRQINLLEKGEKVVNETRAWDAILKKTLVLREKEEEKDYRFMPETNLPPLNLHVNENQENRADLVHVVSLRKQLPELPDKIRERLRSNEVSTEVITSLLNDIKLLKLFDKLTEDKNRTPRKAANCLANIILTFLYKHKLSVDYCFDNFKCIVAIIDLICSKSITLPVAARILEQIYEDPNKTPIQIVEENNWFLITDEVKIREVCLTVIENNPKAAAAYRKSGKERAYQKLFTEFLNTTNHCVEIELGTKLLKESLNQHRT